MTCEHCTRKATRQISPLYSHTLTPVCDVHYIDWTQGRI